MSQNINHAVKICMSLFTSTSSGYWPSWASIDSPQTLLSQPSLITMPMASKLRSEQWSPLMFLDLGSGSLHTTVHELQAWRGDCPVPDVDLSMRSTSCASVATCQIIIELALDQGTCKHLSSSIKYPRIFSSIVIPINGF